MANEDVQKLVAVVEARSAAAEKQMERFVRAADRRIAEFEKRASQAAVKVETTMTGAFSKISGAAKNLGASIVAGIGLSSISSIFDRVVSAAERLDKIGDQAAKLGQSAGQYVQWSQALAMAGGEAEQFAASAEDLIGKIGKLEGGIGKVKVIKQALEAIGSSPEALVNASSLGDRLLLISEALQNIKSPEVRAAFADALGIRPMLPLLEQGRSSVQGLVDDMKGIGDAAQAGVDATGGLADQLGRLRQELEYKEDNLFVRLAPAIANVYQGLINLLNIWSDPRFRAIWGMTSIGGAMNTGSGLSSAINGGSSTTAPFTLKGIQDAIGMKPIPSGSGLAGEIDKVSAAAQKAADKLRELSKARADWRNDPEAKADTRQSLEDISENQKLPELDRMSKRYEEFTKPLRDEFRNAFRYAFSQLSEGDFGGAAATFAGAFVDKINDRLSDQLFDFVWDSLGLGDLASSIFGPAEVAAAAQATASYQTTAAINVMGNAALNAAAALANVGSGSGGGILSGIIGGLLGGTGPIKGVGSGIGGGIGKRALGGPVIAGQPYIVGEKRPELFVPNTSGHIIPRIPQAVSRGASLTFAPVINAPGADPAAITRIEAMMQRSQADFRVWAANEKGRVRGHVADLRSRRAL